MEQNCTCEVESCRNLLLIVKPRFVKVQPGLLLIQESRNSSSSPFGRIGQHNKATVPMRNRQEIVAGALCPISFLPQPILSAELGFSFQSGNGRIVIRAQDAKEDDFSLPFPLSSGSHEGYTFIHFLT